jgi:hypothetical protein
MFAAHQRCKHAWRPTPAGVPSNERADSTEFSANLGQLTQEVSTEESDEALVALRNAASRPTDGLRKKTVRPIFKRVDSFLAVLTILSSVTSV